MTTDTAQPRRRPAYELVAVVFAVVVLAALVVATAKVLIVLFAGVLFALFLQKIASWLEAHAKLPYGVWLTFLIIAILTGIAVAVPLLGPRLAEQGAELAKRLPDAVHTILERLRHGPLAPATEHAASKLSAGTNAKSVAGAALGAVSVSAEVLAGLGVVFFVGVYGAAQPAVYKRALLAITPAAERPRMERVVREVSGTLSRWLLGRVVAMLFVGVTTAIAFHLLGVPLPIALAIFAGLLTFIEYVGAILSAIPPILLAFTVSPTIALWVLVLFTGIHIVEGYVLSPLIARVAVHFPPGFTIAGQVILSALVGILGLTFSTPLLVVAYVATTTWRADAGGGDEPPAG